MKNLVNPVSGDLIMKFPIGVLKEKSFKHIIRILFGIDNESKIYIFQLWMRLIEAFMNEGIQIIRNRFTNRSDFIFKDHHNPYEDGGSMHVFKTKKEFNHFDGKSIIFQSI
ncbi:hypothetical protein STZ1_10509 [Bacillus subtilis]